MNEKRIRLKVITDRGSGMYERFEEKINDFFSDKDAEDTISVTVHHESNGLKAMILYKQPI